MLTGSEGLLAARSLGRHNTHSSSTFRGSCANQERNGKPSHLDVNGALDATVKEKLDHYQYNERNFFFLPAVTTTSGRISGDFLRLLFVCVCVCVRERECVCVCSYLHTFRTYIQVTAFASGLHHRLGATSLVSSLTDMPLAIIIRAGTISQMSSSSRRLCSKCAGKCHCAVNTCG